MRDKKVLYVSSEVLPYSPYSELANMSFEAPRMVNANGGQIRIFMPKFGNINERRHQLHEVIRLSGINIVINDIDVPLIIKVASIPKERIQVYFIDNDEYFHRSGTLFDEQNNMYPDNDERCIFFAKGIVETVKKLNWLPDIIHIHGWVSTLLYLRSYYKDEPIFSESKIITSVTDADFEGTINTGLINKVAFDGISKKTVDPLKNPTYHNLMRIAVKYSDGVIVVSEEDKMPEDFRTYLKNLRKPVLYNSDKETFQESYHQFYEKILKK